MADLFTFAAAQAPRPAPPATPEPAPAGVPLTVRNLRFDCPGCGEAVSYDLAPLNVALLCERCSFWGVERHQALLDLRDRFAALASAEPT